MCFEVFLVFCVFPLIENIKAFMLKLGSQRSCNSRQIMSWDPDAVPSTQLDSSSSVESVADATDCVVVISDDDSVHSTQPADIVLPSGPALPSGLILPSGPATSDMPLVSVRTIDPFRHFNRMDEVVFKCSFFDNIFWALAPPGACLQNHLDFVLNDILSDARSHFKVGLTYLPHDRIFTYCDYCKPNRRMYVVAVNESPHVIAEAEDAAIARYSLLHSETGHPGCRNRSRGELGAYHGMSPFFLYICIGNGNGWLDKGRCNMDARPWVPHVAEWDRSRSIGIASSSTEWETAFGRRLQAARRRSDVRSRSPRTASEPA